MLLRPRPTARRETVLILRLRLLCSIIGMLTYIKLIGMGTHGMYGFTVIRLDAIRRQG